MKPKSSVYKETRNGMVGEDYSSKFSAGYFGCISPRT
jgi:deoxyribodipyrimidine photo-lyase